MIQITVPFQRLVQVSVVMGIDNLAYDIPLVQHGLGPTLQFLITDLNGNPINLTPFGVNFFFKRFDDEFAVNAGHPQCVLVDPMNGLAEYDFVSGDLCNPGTFFGDLELVSGGVSGLPFYEETAPQVTRFIVRESNQSKVKPPHRRHHRSNDRFYEEELRTLMLSRQHDERLINDIVFGGLPPPPDTRRMKRLRERLRKAMARSKPPYHDTYEIRVLTESMRLELDLERERQQENLGNDFEVE